MNGKHIIMWFHSTTDIIIYPGMWTILPCKYERQDL